jgi:hypothetical protein
LVKGAKPGEKAVKQTLLPEAVAMQQRMRGVHFYAVWFTPVKNAPQKVLWGPYRTDATYFPVRSP